MTSTPSNPKWTKPPSQINSVSISDDGSKCVYGSSYERGSGYFYTYLYDNNGNQLWKKPVLANQVTYQGVFWVAISGDGNYVASGGETEDSYNNPSAISPGFLQAYDASTGKEMLNVTKSARINQVSLSRDGMYLAVCYGNTVEVFIKKKQLMNPGEYFYTYSSIFKEKSDNFNIKSCVISHDGSTVVAAGFHWTNPGDSSNQSRGLSTTDPNTGKVFSYAINGSSVTKLGDCPTSVGCMRVSVTDNGQYWAGSLHDGSCILIKSSTPTSKEWQCTPTQANLELAYAVDITETDEGDVYIACGANLSGTGNGGFLYLVHSAPAVFDQQTDVSDYPPTKTVGSIQWSKEIQFGVNPGVSMNKNATYVTATDGKPDGNSVVESAGSFYLYEAASGNLIWQQPTFMMNWPMQISYDGTSVVGGSDDGTFYYWDITAS